MASATAPRFQLISTQTAIAVLVPSHQQSDISALRKVHDKAFRKWPPHINLLYPFVESSRLDEAVAVLRTCLREGQTAPVKVRIDEVGVFEHRRNATVFLKPDCGSGDALCALRATLARALGCSESEGTHDGEFRPHLTIGQAGLIGPTLQRLKDKVKSLVGFEWESATLAVLRRETSGELTVVDELALGNQEKNAEVASRTLDNGWRTCYSFSKNGVWGLNGGMSEAHNTSGKAMSFKVSTYNLMTEDFTPPFTIRLPLITKALWSTTTLSDTRIHVLCLQEINEESLPLLLADPFIQERYPFSSHSPTSVLPSHRNLVTLASVPFSHFKLDFEERHKSALVVSLHDRAVDVANVHLTSALTNQAVYSKTAQMAALTEFLEDRHALLLREIIVAGDFNITTSTRTIETAISSNLISQATADAVQNLIDSTLWEDVFLTGDVLDMNDGEVHDGEDGATFDRLTNPYAAMAPVVIDKCPQRYDRVLFRKSGLIEPKQCEVFGRPDKLGQCGSDHYGVSANLAILDNTNKRLEGSMIRASKVQIIDTQMDVQSLLAEYLPTQSDVAQRETALALLKSTLSSHTDKNDTILVPLGSYLMDTYFSSSDVDVLIIGTSSPQVFFDRVTSQLRELGTDESNDGIKGVHFVNSLVPIIEAVVLGIKFDLQYCQSPELIEKLGTKAENLIDLVFDSALIAKLSPSALRPLNTYRDTAYLLRTTPALSLYRVAHRFLSLYLKRRGLYSAKFGYLGGIHLSLLLNRVVKLMSATQSPKGKAAELSASTIISTFFTYYAEFDWAMDIVYDPARAPTTQRTQRDPLYIQSIHVPTARPNVASSCTRLSAQTLTNEFRLAAQQLEKRNWEWCLRPTEIVVEEFLKSSGAYVRISLDIWDVDEIGGDRVREIVGGIESKMTRLLVSLGRLEGLEGRVWPARFRTAGDVGLGNQFKGYYLVSISANDGMEPERKKLLSGKVIAAVREFEMSVKTSREVEGGNVWIEMGVIPRKKISAMNLVLDERDWGVQSPRDAPTQLAPAPEGQTSSSSNNLQATPGSLSSHRRSSSTSLRPAQDIISRIKWDPDLNIEDFMIGYEDRFVGVKETELGRWKSEQTDEEFIPMHRIVWVRRKGGDEMKVWDRKAKVDLLFGSGVGDGK